MPGDTALRDVSDFAQGISPALRTRRHALNISARPEKVGRSGNVIRTLPELQRPGALGPFNLLQIRNAGIARRAAAPVRSGIQVGDCAEANCDETDDNE